MKSVKLIILLFITETSFAQNPLMKQWDYRFGGSDDELFQKLNDYENHFQIEIKNMLGQTVLLQQENKSQFKINISQLPKGVYFIKVKADNNLYTQKFSKQ